MDEKNCNCNLSCNCNCEPTYNIAPRERRLFGRKIIYADYKASEMSTKTISKILNDVFSLHLQNAEEIDYLEKYYKGYQPIIGKTKEVRPTINNIVVENNAYFITEFKKSYVFGQPIQYVVRGEKFTEEIDTLNGYMLADDKFPKDTELAESLYISEGTVKNYISSIYDKTGIHDRAKLIVAIKG